MAKTTLRELPSGVTLDKLWVFNLNISTDSVYECVAFGSVSVGTT